MTAPTKTLVIGLLAVAGAFASCNGQATSTEKTAAVNSSIPAPEFETRMQQPGAQLLDVRSSEEFAGGHLKAARNENIQAPDFESRIRDLDKNRPVLVYCLSGGRSGQAAELLSELGFKEVYNLEGGLVNWNASGKALDSGNNANAEKAMSQEQFATLVQSQHYVLVDYNAKWCKPCLRMLPMLEELARKKSDKLTLLRIDADTQKQLLAAKKITHIPYLELYLNGKLIWQHAGSIEESELLQETGL